MDDSVMIRNGRGARAVFYALPTRINNKKSETAFKTIVLNY
jgi:hypothetical protein